MNNVNVLETYPCLCRSSEYTCTYKQSVVHTDGSSVKNLFIAQVRADGSSVLSINETLGLR